MQIGLFYGSTTCYTEMAAENIADQFARLGIEVVLHNIKTQSLQACYDYPVLIFGISTWDFGEIQEDWLSHWDEVANLDLQGKTLALYGLGDQLGYSDWFLDALGLLHDLSLTAGAKIIGHWPIVGYQFNQSKALMADQQHFVGLALDDENQFELSETRIQQWVEQLLAELV